MIMKMKIIISVKKYLNDPFNNYIQKFVVIIAGSTSDEKHCFKIQSKLREKIFIARFTAAPYIKIQEEYLIF